MSSSYPKYMFEKKKIKEMKNALEARMNRLVQPARTFPRKKRKGMSMISSVPMSPMTN